MRVRTMMVGIAAGGAARGVRACRYQGPITSIPRRYCAPVSVAKRLETTPTPSALGPGASAAIGGQRPDRGPDRARVVAPVRRSTRRPAHRPDRPGEHRGGFAGARRWPSCGGSPSALGGFVADASVQSGREPAPPGHAGAQGPVGPLRRADRRAAADRPAGVRQRRRGGRERGVRGPDRPRRQRPADGGAAGGAAAHPHRQAAGRALGGARAGAGAGGDRADGGPHALPQEPARS